MGDLLERSDALDERIAGSAAVEDLVRASRRHRFFIRALSVSVALDVLLSAVVAVVAWEAVAVAQQANSIQARQHQNCVIGNETRAGQLELWHYLLALPPPSPRTEAEQHQADQFRTYVDRLFAPRPCP